ncbi:hypothetical protein ACIBJI_34380 [Nocardia sp. NPDC050408]|uniref:hypothetical protein n=1 Tax=Nocardia sp. NPDC050408 TaxID=3364319 RepID=UPI0037B5E784
MRSFLIELLPLHGQFLLDLAFLSETLALLTLSEFFFLHLHHVVGCELEFCDPEPVIVLGDMHLHHVSELGDRGGSLVQTAYGRRKVSSPDGTNTDVGLGVIGAQHELRQI